MQSEQNRRTEHRVVARRNKVFLSFLTFFALSPKRARTRAHKAHKTPHKRRKDFDEMPLFFLTRKKNTDNNTHTTKKRIKICLMDVFNIA